MEDVPLNEMGHFQMYISIINTLYIASETKLGQLPQDFSLMKKNQHWFG